MARTPPNARLITHRGNSQVLIAVGGQAPPGRVEALRRAGAEVFQAGGGRRVNLKVLLEELGKRGVKRLLVEGGGNLNWSLFKEGLVDEVQVAISPVIIGGKDAVTLVEGEGFGSIGEARRLRLEAVEKAGFNLVLKYKVEG